MPTQDQQARSFVPEGIVTDEIRQDLLSLGWLPIDDLDADHMS
jgi:hypothetical protein